jgi:hypothetical protein
MTFPFRWNEFADQPHNVAPRRERFRHHLKHAGGYVDLALSGLAVSLPALRRYRQYSRTLYQYPVDLVSPFAVSSSPAGDKNEAVIAALETAGVRRTLVRLPSWERGNLSRYEAFIRLLHGAGIDVVAALLQRREDVLNPGGWQGFLEDVFSGFSSLCSFFEVGHAWNRTKWGVWDHREYIELAQPAAALARNHGTGLVGPAVIDFEFHLYPPVLKAVNFDKVSSLLYVDRTGAPENAQFGWTTAKKVALLRAVVDVSAVGTKESWITEMNWPLRGTGEFSPAPGKPSVTEDEQADYLVRYFIICVASGLVERVFWWQLVAPGYGLIDSRGAAWRKRPAYFALATMIKRLEGSRFVARVRDRDCEIFLFRRAGEEFAVCWTNKGAVDYRFSRRPRYVIGRDGRENRVPADKIRIEERPQYVFFS